jgi:hypothetical protein
MHGTVLLQQQAVSTNYSGVQYTSRTRRNAGRILPSCDPCHAMRSRNRNEERKKRTRGRTMRQEHQSKHVPKVPAGRRLYCHSRTRRARPSARAHQGQLHAAAIFLGRCRHRACTGAAGVGAAGQQGPVPCWSSRTPGQDVHPVLATRQGSEMEAQDQHRHKHKV